MFATRDDEIEIRLSKPAVLEIDVDRAERRPFAFRRSAHQRARTRRRQNGPESLCVLRSTPDSRPTRRAPAATPAPSAIDSASRGRPPPAESPSSAAGRLRRSPTRNPTTAASVRFRNRSSATSTTRFGSPHPKQLDAQLIEQHQLLDLLGARQARPALLRASPARRSACPARSSASRADRRPWRSAALPIRETQTRSSRRESCGRRRASPRRSSDR